MILARCIFCTRRLWFARSGHRVLPGGLVARWHTACRTIWPGEEIVGWVK